MCVCESVCVLEIERERERERESHRMRERRKMLSICVGIVCLYVCTCRGPTLRPGAQLAAVCRFWDQSIWPGGW